MKKNITFDENKVDTKLLKQLKPISQVLLRALMEPSYASAYKNQAVEFLAEAERVWKNQHPERSYTHPGAYYLGRTYQIMEAQRIISADGHVLDPQALAAPNRINGRICRPRAFAPIDYENTATFKKLAVPPKRIKEGKIIR